MYRDAVTLLSVQRRRPRPLFEFAPFVLSGRSCRLSLHDHHVALANVICRQRLEVAATKEDHFLSGKASSRREPARELLHSGFVQLWCDLFRRSIAWRTPP